MADYLTISIKTEHKVADLDIGKDPDSNASIGLRKLSEFLAAVAGGARHAEVLVNAGAVRASQTATFGTTDGNLTVNGTVFAYTGASAAARAADAAAKVNASSTNGVRCNVYAEYVPGATTLTLVSKIPGTVGNFMSCSITGTGASVGGAGLAGGVDAGPLKKYAKGF